MIRSPPTASPAHNRTTGLHPRTPARLRRVRLPNRHTEGTADRLRFITAPMLSEADLARTPGSVRRCRHPHQRRPPSSLRPLTGNACLTGHISTPGQQLLRPSHFSLVDSRVGMERLLLTRSIFEVWRDRGFLRRRSFYTFHADDVFSDRPDPASRERDIRS